MVKKDLQRNGSKKNCREQIKSISTREGSVSCRCREIARSSRSYDSMEGSFSDEMENILVSHLSRNLLLSDALDMSRLDKHSFTWMIADIPTHYSLSKIFIFLAKD